MNYEASVGDLNSTVVTLWRMDLHRLPTVNADLALPDALGLFRALFFASSLVGQVGQGK